MRPKGGAEIADLHPSITADELHNSTIPLTTAHIYLRAPPATTIEFASNETRGQTKARYAAQLRCSCQPHTPTATRHSPLNTQVPSQQIANRPEFFTLNGVIGDLTNWNNDFISRFICSLAVRSGKKSSDGTTN